MFKPILSVAAPLMRTRYRFGRRAIYAVLGVVVGADLLFLLVSPEGLGWLHSKGKSDITQQVSVEIRDVNPETRTIRVVGDLVGIMGMDVVVTPQTWIGIDRQLAAFGQLRDGLRANISFVRQGEKRVARWIAASSSRTPEESRGSEGPVGAAGPAPGPAPVAGAQPAAR